jgi:hypothetical protein
VAALSATNRHSWSTSGAVAFSLGSPNFRCTSRSSRRWDMRYARRQVGRRYSRSCTFTRSAATCLTATAAAGHGSRSGTRQARPRCGSRTGASELILGRKPSGLAGPCRDRFARAEDSADSVASVAISGAVAGVVGIEGGVVSEVFNLESSGVDAPDRRPRHDQEYHED